MAKIYLTRHGETEWNYQNKMQGWKDSKLTELGKQQAEWLRDRLLDIEFDSIYSSPLSRAYETAKIINNDREDNIDTDSRLKEMSFGDWEGKTTDQIKDIWPTDYDHFWNKPHKYNNKSGESFEDLKERTFLALDDILSKSKENILIVTHTVVIKILMAHFENRKLKDLWDPPYIHQTCLNVIDIDSDKVEILLHGDTSHHK